MQYLLARLPMIETSRSGTSGTNRFVEQRIPCTSPRTQGGDPGRSGRNKVAKDYRRSVLREGDFRVVWPLTVNDRRAP